MVGISGLELVWLSKLTREQLTEIFRMVADRRCPRMRWISLYDNDIQTVPEDLRDRAKLNYSVQIKY